MYMQSSCRHSKLTQTFALVLHQIYCHSTLYLSKVSIMPNYMYSRLVVVKTHSFFVGNVIQVSLWHTNFIHECVPVTLRNYTCSKKIFIIHSCINEAASQPAMAAEAVLFLVGLWICRVLHVATHHLKFSSWKSERRQTKWLHGIATYNGNIVSRCSQLCYSQVQLDDFIRCKLGTNKFFLSSVEEILLYSHTIAAHCV